MNLTFLKIRWKNFLSTGNIFTEIDLHSHGMTLIIGENGEGKSTFIDAICFALFNVPFRKINKPQLVNSVTKKDCVVEVEFTTRGKHYRVVRGIKPAIFEIWRDGVLINQDAASRDYQHYLEKHILRTNFKTFSQIGILGSASYTPFMQLKSAERRKIIEDIYDLQIFTSMNSLLKTKLDGIQRSIKDLQAQKELLTQRLELSRNHQEVRSEDKQKQIEDRRTEISQNQKAIDEQQAEVDKIQGLILDLVGKTADDVSHRAKFQKLQKLETQIITNAASIKKEIKFLKEHDNCPTCKQIMDSDFVDKVIKEKTEKLKEIDSGLVLLKAQLDEQSKIIQGLNAIQSEIQQFNTSMIVVRSKISTLKSRNRKLENDIADLESEHEEIVDESQLIEIESELSNQRSIEAELKEKVLVMDYVGSLLKDTGIKSKIIKKYSGKFNELVNAYLAKLDFFVDFYLDENFEETIKSRGRDSFTYNSFSEGEKLRIDLAVLFAWRDIAKIRASLNTNLLIMDETFEGSMDDVGKGELIKIMRGATNENNIFVISHAELIRDHFDRTIKFTKTRGFSRIATS